MNWTGAGPDGTAQNPLGSDTVSFRLVTDFGAGWVAWGDTFMSELEVSMYAISGVLTAVPEPGSSALVGVRLLGQLRRGGRGERESGRVSNVLHRR